MPKHKGEKSKKVQRQLRAAARKEAYEKLTFDDKVVRCVIGSREHSKLMAQLNAKK